MKVRLRKATKDDRKVIEAMDTLCFPGGPEAKVRIHQVWWIGVDEDDQPVCYVGATPWDFKEEKYLYLHRTGVLPVARGLGLQKRMIHLVLRHAKKEGYPEVVSYTAHDNIYSANNFIRTGFTLWEPATWGGERDPLAVTDDTGWLFWRKELILLLHVDLQFTLGGCEPHHQRNDHRHQCHV